jgi:hypothetical protein
MDDSAGFDIVERAIAILDEEVRSWAEEQRLQPPSMRVQAADEPKPGGPGG